MDSSDTNAATRCDPRPGPTGKAVSLTVLAGGQKVKRSRAGRWRALVLVLVNAAMVAHLIQWVRAGVTLSPVEPSESMYTFEAGEVNAGFVFFALAILSTFLFGRFFCGWGCHVVSLQDACTWLLGKIGIRPKPFRSRLLVWVPLVLGFYMFAWQPLLRNAVMPGLSALHARFPSLPDWMVMTPPAFPGFRNAFIVEDYWKTFPAWYVAVPFLLICGFAVVYFLGSKGFCTYGCPYGGIFGVVDRVGVGRIVVSEACNGCGHCTANCTSNVRVHQEVKDFGMVVDPGCMKCMDCVSTCPNHALSFAFAKPSALAKPRRKDTPSKPKPAYDLSWTEEIAVALVGLGLFLGYRGFLNQTPMLMAVGIAAIGAFCAWKLWSLLRVPNVRLQNLQLRAKGKLTPAAYVFIPLTLALLAVGAWSGWVRALRWRADRLDGRITTAEQVVFAPGYAPNELDKAHALRALALYERSDSRGHGGWGWPLPAALQTRVAWLSAVAGDMPGAQAAIERAASAGKPSEDVVMGLAKALALQNKPPQAWPEALQAILAAQPHAYHARNALGFEALRRGDTRAAGQHFEAAFANIRKADETELVRAGMGLLQIAQGSGPAEMESAAAALRDRLLDAVSRKPSAVELRVFAASILLQTSLQQGGDRVAQQAQRLLRTAIDHRPRDPMLPLRAGQVMLEVGRRGEALSFYEEGAELLRNGRGGHSPAMIEQVEGVIRNLRQGVEGGGGGGGGGGS